MKRNEAPVPLTAADRRALQVLACAEVRYAAGRIRISVNGAPADVIDPGEPAAAAILDALLDLAYAVAERRTGKDVRFRRDAREERVSAPATGDSWPWR